MPYVVPSMPLTANGWRYATWQASFPPVVPVPDYTTLCNLAMARKFVGWGPHTMWLYVPAGTDIRDGMKEQTFDVVAGIYACDIVEVPAGSGRYYFVSVVDDVGKGFSNVYRAVSIQVPDYPGFPIALPPWPTPYP